MSAIDCASDRIRHRADSTGTPRPPTDDDHGHPRRVTDASIDTRTDAHGHQIQNEP
jgi:hypothetical protein